jgi:FtsP/CotA-like multicopper oxidase with cupredoxin domain
MPPHTLIRKGRRRFLKLAGYGTLGLMAGGFRPLLSHSMAAQAPKDAPDEEFLPDLDISLTARPALISVFPGNSTQVWRYEAMLHKGDRSRVQQIPGSYLGPIIKMHSGEKIRVRFKNAIPEETIVHWHGLHVPAIMDGHPLPERLSEISRPLQDEAVNFLRPRRFYLTMRHMQWTINGRLFQMEEVADDEIVQLGSKEIWEFHNTGGGMMKMMNMPHPIHLHGKQFRIIERSGVAHDGYVDQGWKDTVLLMPGERIRILVDFEDYPGMFLYHCHNLEHEDMGMMRNYFIRKNA